MRKNAVRGARKLKHGVELRGPGASKKARGVVKEAHRDKGTVRHDHDGAHWQPEKKVTVEGQSVGQVHYTVKSVVTAIAGAGAAAGASVSDATGSEALGNVVATVVDLLNPATDIVEGAGLVDDIAEELIEEIYDVELDEEEEEEEGDGETEGGPAEWRPRPQGPPEAGWDDSCKDAGCFGRGEGGGRNEPVVYMR